MKNFCSSSSCQLRVKYQTFTVIRDDMAFINLVIEANYDVPQTLHHIKVTKTYGEIPCCMISLCTLSGDTKLSPYYHFLPNDFPAIDA